MKLTLGERLKDERIKRNLTIKEVCSQTAISQGVLSDYENDKKEPGAAALSSLAAFYGVSMDYLYGRTEIRSPDADIQAICARTGLAQETIQFLINNQHKEVICSFVDQLLGYDFLSWILDAYLEYKEIRTNPDEYFHQVELFENATRKLENPLTSDILGRHNAEEYALFKLQHNFLEFIKSVGDDK